MAANPSLARWGFRAAAPLVLLALDAAGLKFTPALLRKGCLAVLYSTALTASAVYYRIKAAGDVRTLRAARRPGEEEETVSVQEYDTRALKDLVVSVVVGLGFAYTAHAYGWSSNMLCVQLLLLPLSLFQHELVALHLHGQREAGELVRPWRSEPEKLKEAAEGLLASFGARAGVPSPSPKAVKKE